MKFNFMTVYRLYIVRDSLHSDCSLTPYLSTNVNNNILRVNRSNNSENLSLFLLVCYCLSLFLFFN